MTRCCCPNTAHPQIMESSNNLITILVDPAPLHSSAGETTTMRLLRLSLLVLAIMARSTATAMRCEQLELDAPARVTLFQSKQNASEAVVLRPDCSAKIVPTTPGEDGAMELIVNASEIAVVASYPPCDRMCVLVMDYCR